MDIAGLPWWQHGKKLSRECTPVFRFEGKGVFSKDSGVGVGNKWQAQNKSVAFVNLHHNTEESLDDWQPSGNDFRFTKCLSTMFIQNVSIDIIQNSMGKNFAIGLYENEKLKRKITIIPANTLPVFFTKDLSPGLSIKLDFDQDYAWGFKTTDGSFPTFNDSNFTIEFTISCLIVMGAGDP